MKNRKSAIHKTVLAVAAVLLAVVCFSGFCVSREGVVAQTSAVSVQRDDFVTVSAGHQRSVGVRASVSDSLKRTFVEEDRWKDLLSGLGITILLTMVTLILGSAAGFGLFLWRYTDSKIAIVTLRWFSWLFGLLPPATWLLIVYYLIFWQGGKNGTASAIFGLTVLFAAMVYGTLMGALESIPQGQMDAATTMGYNKYQSLYKILFPQIMPRFLANIESAVILHIQNTAIVEVIGVLDIQAVADTISAKTLEPVVPILLIAVVYVAYTALACYLVRCLRQKLYPEDPGEEQIRQRLMKGQKK